MPESQKQLVERIKQAQNVLVTVSKNPSVDQLAAAIGLTLALNHLGKHATAVFSGEVPSTLEFLKPEETLEKNTDSLRDFIIALDKSKADKLRYKVEDNVVRIFITPYRTSISDKDLQFSQGDFNVEVVVALGVGNQQDLDEAITQHGRILHDATVATIATQQGGDLGSINWFEEQSSSLSEMVVNLIDALDKKAMDNQMATALLTGIVAATERFRNEKTTPKTMSASAELMAAGANQQLVATQLETPAEPPVSEPSSSEGGQNGDGSQPPEEVNNDPGMLAIDHQSDPSDQPAPPEKEESEPEEEEPESPIDTTLTPEPEVFEESSGPQVHVDENGRLSTEPATESGLPHIGPVHGTASEGISEPDLEAELPEMNFEDPERTEQVGLTANTMPEPLDPSTETLAQPNLDTPVLTHDQPAVMADSDAPATLPTEIVEPTVPPPASPPAPFSPPPAPAPVVVSNDQPVSSDPSGIPAAPLAVDPPAQPPLPVVTSDETLDEIEAAVGSKYHDLEQPAADVASARDAVEAALSGAGGQDAALEPITALNAQPFGTVDHAAQPATPAQPPLPNAGFNEPTPGTSPADSTLDMPLPSFGGAAPAANPLIPIPSAPQPAVSDSGTPPPPPVPPPPILPPLQ